MTTNQIRVETLLLLIKDAYRRIATNRDQDYRTIQLNKINTWLTELSALYESDPDSFTYYVN